MDSIADLLQIWKDEGNLLDFEEKATDYMRQWMCRVVAQLFNQLDGAVQQEMRRSGWTCDSHRDQRTLQFLFGPVTFTHTRMLDPEGKASYPLDRVLKLRKWMRYSPKVEYEVAALAGRMPYRKVKEALSSWTQVQMSQTSVMHCVRHVGLAQEKQDQERVIQGERGELEGNSQPTYLFAEADGTLVRGLEKHHHQEVHHFIMYEGWTENGKRRFLKRPWAVMTSRSLETFWQQVSAAVADHYQLDHVQVVANSDGGAGYDTEHFREAFFGSAKPLIVQLDPFHVAQSLTRAFHGDQEWVRKVQEAIREKDRDTAVTLIDTFESHLDGDSWAKKVEETKHYLLNHWDRLLDWRTAFDKQKLPPHAGRMGSMESNQRYLTFRMKKRGMHWGHSLENMVKVIQGMRNGTLRDTYLAAFLPSAREQKEIRKLVRLGALFYTKTRPSIGVHQGRIGGYASASSPIGQMGRKLALTS